MAKIIFEIRMIKYRLKKYLYKCTRPHNYAKKMAKMVGGSLVYYNDRPMIHIKYSGTHEIPFIEKSEMEKLDKILCAYLGNVK